MHVMKTQKNIFIILVIMALSTLTMNAQTKVIAHRGFSGVAPENTLASFKKAIESGAEYLELDVHKTADDFLVVIHDYTIDRTTSNDMKGKIKKMTYEELSAIKVGYSEKFGDNFKDEKIPTLKEVLELAKGKIKVCIEIKALDVEEEVIKLVNDLNMHSDVVIFSFHFEVLTKIRQLDKDIEILYLKNNADRITVDYANLINVNAIGGGYDTKVTKDLLDYAHKNNVEIWRWTVNTEEEMQALVDVGVDGIITNFPDKALTIANGK